MTETPGELRLRLVDPKALNPLPMMPAFYKTDGLNRVMKGFEGKPILTAQQVEDIIAHLMTLPPDDPEKHQDDQELIAPQASRPTCDTTRN